MSGGLVAAAALLGLLGVAHSYLGERYILVRLFRRNDLPRLFGSDRFTKDTLRFAWHLTTVAWFGLAAVLVELAVPGPPHRAMLLRTIGATFGLSAVVSVVGSRGRHLSWVVFTVAASRALKIE